MGARAARLATRLATADPRTDAELASEAGDGGTAAFEALYRRHADTAWRVAYAVTGNADDASDAVAEAFTRVMQSLTSGRLADAALFRSYLMAATRNAAIDVSRRAGRVRHTDRMDQLDDQARFSATPGERVNDAADLSLVAEAFRSLPERWRSVLWLTEVEGIPPKEAAALLGVTPNNAAQLAVRARAGLRERFVQAHLQGTEPVPQACRFTVERLGGYVTGRLAPRDLAKVDQHLAGCESCRQRHDELEDVGGSLRRIIVPVPMLLGSTVVAKWQLAGAGTVAAVASKTAASATSSAAVASKVAAGTAGGSVKSIELLGKLQKPLLAASTGIFALGVISASVMGFPGATGGGIGGDGRQAPIALPRPANTPVVDEVVEFVPAVSQRPDGLRFGGGDGGEPAAGGLPPTQADLPASTATPRTLPGGVLPPPPAGPAGQSIPPPDDAAPAAVAQVGVAGRLGPLEGGLTASDQCQGGSLNGEGMGCEPPAPEASVAGVTVVTDGSGPAAPLAGQSETLGL